MSCERAEIALSRRFEELDAEPATNSGQEKAASRLGHFVRVMSRWTDSLVETEVGAGAVVAPDRADALAGNSQLLAGIGELDASLATGPMSRAGQHWTPGGQSALTGEPPSEKRFIAPMAAQPPAVKPFGCGLYTSTVTAAGVSMWRAFLGPGGSDRVPLPRFTWEMEIDGDVNIVEIGSATAWVEFVNAHALVRGDQVYPDWIEITRSCDAVHFTVSAIAAAQGFCFNTALGTIPAAFWDVESTFWLRWCFSGCHSVEAI